MTTRRKAIGKNKNSINTSSTNSGRKLAGTTTLVKCFKCKSQVDLKDTLQCSLCKNRYEFDCEGMSEKLYRLMAPDNKKKWKCKMCNKPNRESANVTVRKRLQSPKPTNTLNLSQCPESSNPPDTQQNSSDMTTTSDLSDESLESPDRLSRSVDYALTDSTSAQEMQDTIEKLTSQLASLQNEFDETVLQNNDLQRINKQLSMENNTLKLLCQSTLPENDSIRHSGKKKNKGSTKILSPSPPMFMTPKSSRTSIISTNNDSEFSLILTLQKKIIEQEKNLKEAESEILNLTKQINLLERKSYSPEQHKLFSTTHTELNTFRKINILGTQQCCGLATKIINSRENTSYEKYHTSAFIKPNAITDEVLKGLETIPKYNRNDKVILCIGENDCNPTNVCIKLSIALGKIPSNIMIIVLCVLNNKHLNVKLLNRNIQMICNNFKNCTFITVSPVNKNYIEEIATKINFVIDSYDYNEKFLTFNNRKPRNNLTKQCNLNVMSGSILGSNKNNKPRKMTQMTLHEFFPRVSFKAKRNNTQPMPCTSSTIQNEVTEGHSSQKSFFRPQTE